VTIASSVSARPPRAKSAPGPEATVRSSQDAATNEQQSRILRATQQTIAEHGYAASTVTEIIARAGISSKTFYKHFADKLDAALALMHLIVDEATSRIENSIDRHAPWPERVYSSLEFLLALLAENPQIARFVVVEIQAAGPRALADYHRLLRQYASSLEPRATEMSGRLQSRPGVADQIAGAISQLLYDNIVTSQIADLPDLLPDLTEIALAPYIGPQRAAAFVNSHAKRVNSV
jgi:AcrR family transcriptional regulator